MAVNGKSVLITGAGRGMGRYIAHSFAKASARITIADVDANGVETVAAELRSMGATVLAVTVDVRNESQVKDMVDRAAREFGAIDVLVNNAAIVTHSHWWRVDPEQSPPWPRVRDLGKDVWDRVIDTNLGGTFLCTKHVLPYMEAQRSGHIVNLHGGALPGQAGVSPYVVSKDALRTFTQFLAEEEREWNVCVLIVTPGTAMATEGAPEAVLRDFPAPESLGDAFVRVAELDMTYSGKLLNLKGGGLQPVE